MLYPLYQYVPELDAQTDLMTLLRGKPGDRVPFRCKMHSMPYEIGTFHDAPSECRRRRAAAAAAAAAC